MNENGEATYRAIVEAASEVLAVRGWAAATVAAVASRAGVTRGAVQHHFKDRLGLVTAAIKHVLDTRIREISELGDAVHDEADRTREIVHAVVAMHISPAFAAGLQLCLAAVNDPELRPQVAAMEVNVGARGYWALVDILGLDGRDATVSATVHAFLDSARGLGMAALLNDDSVRRALVCDRWSTILNELRPART